MTEAYVPETGVGISDTIIPPSVGTQEQMAEKLDELEAAIEAFWNP